MNVMVAVAHPDDEVIGCGGTIAKHVEAGDRVTLVTFTDGVTSRTPELPAREMRRRESVAAMVALGIVDEARYGYTDQEMDHVPQLWVARDVARQVQEWAPDVVYTHWPHDLNQDHAVVARAVLVATRPFQCGVRRVLAMEVPESTGATFGGSSFAPNWFVPLSTAQLGKKLEALACYESERRMEAHPRGAVAVTAVAVARGAQAGVEYAEAFELLRGIEW